VWIVLAWQFTPFAWITDPHLLMYIDMAVVLGTIIIGQVFDPIAIPTAW
jgi:sorbitol/mannitol transport system permease protein